MRTVRKHGEQVAQQELAGALGRRDACDAELKLAEELAGGARSQQLAGAERIQTATDLQAQQAWLERTELARTSVAESLSRHEREVERRRRALGVAAREKKALDKLEARQRSAFEQQAARRDTLATDEMALNVFRGNAA